MRDAPALVLSDRSAPRARTAAAAAPSKKPKEQAGARQRSLLGRAFSRPGVAVAGAVFAAVMTGIVTNAVMFQKGHHPSPLFNIPSDPPMAHAAQPPAPAAPGPVAMAPAAAPLPDAAASVPASVPAQVAVPKTQPHPVHHPAAVHPAAAHAAVAHAPPKPAAVKTTASSQHGHDIIGQYLRGDHPAGAKPKRAIQAKSEVAGTAAKSE